MMPLRSSEELDALSVVDPQIQAILSSGKIPRPDLDFGDDHKAIQQLRVLAEAWGKFADREGVSSTTVKCKARDGYENNLLVFRPSDLVDEAKLPVVVHFHGGGGCIGSPESTAPFCQGLVLQHRCIVFAPQYRLGPEHKYPAGVNDCTDALKYIARHATDFGADPSLGFVVGGHSFGASTTGIISLHAKDLEIPAKITGLYLGAGGYIGNKVPAGYENQYRSREDEACKSSPILNEPTKMLFERAYAGDVESPWCRACNAPSMDDYIGQPRAYFQVCGMDVVRDDSLILEDILRKSGAETKMDIYAGTPHLFWNVFTPGTISQASKWAEDTKKGFSWLLAQ